MRKILEILFLCLCFSFNSTAQNNCIVSSNYKKVLCENDTAIINIEPKNANIFWYNSNKEKIDTGVIFKPYISQNSKFYLIHKQDIGNELILNGDFEQGNSFFQSDYYQKCNPGYLPQGAYCITNTSTQFYSTWTGCKDFKNKNGNFLVSDGANIPNQKIWCQTVNVEQNQEYAFSAWVTTLISINPPVMQFSINGKLLGNSFKSNETPCKWEEFFQVWNSENENTAEICIVNQNIEGEGNDFAIDEISLKKTCIFEDSIIISIDEPLKIDLGNSPKICEGDIYKLENNETNIVKTSYKWSTSETTPTINIQTPGNYWLEISNENECTAKDSIDVLAYFSPISALGNDTNVCFTVTEFLELNAGEANNIIWTKNNILISDSNILKITNGGEYKVSLSNGRNCTTEDYIFIDTLCSDVIFFPNAFTPNNDLINDEFKAYSIQTYFYELLIYNRWGNLIYISNDINDGWDGTYQNTPAPQDVYVYYCTYEIVNNKTNKISRKEKTGMFTLYR
jgi:gliding motility-associated-like protein